MKRARIVVLAIAIVAAGAAALIARSMVSGERPARIVEKSMPTTEVLVAASDIKLGDSVGADDLKWQAWPSDAATPGYITKSEESDALSRLSGAIARAPFLSGEPIKAQKLIRVSEGGVLAAILPPGMRAISTPIREETAAGGFILPNDRVDVILTRQVRTGSRDEHVSETVLRNVRVLAIGQSIDQKSDEKVANGKTATLELTPRQAEILALSQQLGDISLSLRSLADANPASGGPQADEAAFGGKSGSIKVLRYNVPSQAFGVN